MIPDNLFQTQKQEQPRAQLATVMEVTDDGVLLRIDGEDATSQAACRYLSSYQPARGDRVYFQRIGGAMLVLGKVM